MYQQSSETVESPKAFRASVKPLKPMPKVIYDAMVAKGFVSTNGEPSYASLAQAIAMTPAGAFGLIQENTHEWLQLTLAMCALLKITPGVMQIILGLPQNTTRQMIRQHMADAKVSVRRVYKEGHRAWVDGIPEDSTARKNKRIFCDLLGIPLADLPYALLIKIDSQESCITRFETVDLTHEPGSKFWHTY